MKPFDNSMKPLGNSMRCRMTFAKTTAMRYTGHLDLNRTLERTIRRANLPLAYSQGFNPRPKMMIASALPLGYTSEHEVVDIWFKEEMPIKDIEQAMKKAVPPGIELLKMEEVDLKAPKLQNSIQSARFEVTLLDQTENLEEKVADLLAKEEIMREKVRKKKTRTYDLRELIFEVKTLPDKDGKQRLEMILRAGEGTTGRPDDVLDELGVDALETWIHRVGITFGG